MPWTMSPTGSDFSGMTGKTMFSYASENMPRPSKMKSMAHMKLYVPTGKVLIILKVALNLMHCQTKSRKKVQAIHGY